MGFGVGSGITSDKAIAFGIEKSFKTDFRIEKSLNIATGIDNNKKSPLELIRFCSGLSSSDYVCDYGIKMFQDY